MRAVIETVFDIFYLVTVLTVGIRMIRDSKTGTQFRLFGLMAVVLGAGDAFHLVPRALALCTTGLENYAVPLGLGKWITSVTMTVFYVLLVMAHTQGAAIALLFAFAISMSGLNPTAVASAGKMTTVTSMGIMLPVAASGAILMPWVIGVVAESAGLAAGMMTNIVPCVGLVIFAVLVAKLPEE